MDSLDHHGGRGGPISERRPLTSLWHGRPCTADTLTHVCKTNKQNVKKKKKKENFAVHGSDALSAYTLTKLCIGRGAQQLGRWPIWRGLSSSLLSLFIF